MKYYFSAVLWYSFIFLLRVIFILGKNRSSFLLGKFIYHFLPYRKKVILANLKLVFPSYTEKELKKITQETYIFYCKMLYEFLVELNNKNFDDLILDDEVKSRLDEYHKEYGSVLIATGHFSNWEIGNKIFEDLKIPVGAIYKRIHNPFIDKKLKTIRERYGTENIKMKQTKKLLRAVKNNMFIFILIDQDAKKRGEIINFLNLETKAYRGPVKISIFTQKPVLPAFLLYDKELGKYKAVLGKELIFCTDPEKERENLEKIHSELGNLIKEYPEQWFWFHKRWKHLY